MTQSLPILSTYQQTLDTAVTPMLQLRQVSYELVDNHTRDVAAIVPVQGVTLTIQRGESIAILGNDSSGKETLLSLLACLVLPTNGNFSLYGYDVATLNTSIHDDLRLRHIGVVFPTPALFMQKSVSENVALPLTYLKLNHVDQIKRVAKALAIVGVTELSTHYPDELTREQCHMVALARALVHNPAMLLLNEPIASLGSIDRHSYLAVLQQCNQRGLTIVFATNDQEIAAYTRRQIIMRNGQLVHDTGFLALPRPATPVIAQHAIDEWLT